MFSPTGPRALRAPAGADALAPDLPAPDALASAQALLTLGYRNVWVHITGHLGLATLVAGASLHVWAWPPLLAWWLWMALLGAGLYLGVAWFERAGAADPARAWDVAELARWRRLYLFSVCLPGVAWGSVSWLFVPAEAVQNQLVMTAFAGAVAYSAVSNAHDVRSFVVSAGIAGLMMAWKLPAIYGADARWLLAMCVFYMAVMSWVSVNAHRMLLDSVRLRLANEALAHNNALQAARAEQANRDKSEFLAAASHDLRQPVHALLLLIEAYRQQERSAAQHPLVQHMASAAQAIGQLFNALMELSRLEAGLAQPQSSRFALREALVLLVNRHRLAAERKGLQVRLRLARGLEHASLDTDRVLFERVVGNLLSNAVRYTARGGVLLALRARPTGWRLQVFDTGAGIALADQARVFDPYVQLANRERDRSQGLGLGLAIVQRACALLHWQVSLRSRPGRGSVFTLHGSAAALVRAPAAAADGLVAGQAERAVVQPMAMWAGRRLLLVDDDPLIQQGMGALLRGWGLDVRIAAQGGAALDAACAADWSPEVVLSDFRLPGEQDGLAVLEQATQRWPQAVGLLLTGELAHTVAQRAEDAGYLLLTKPVLPALLAATLSALLERRSQPRETQGL